MYESNLNVVSSDAVNHDLQVSPLELTIPVKYQRLIQKLYNPLSIDRNLLQQADSLSQNECTQITLHDRFRSFEDTVQAETEELKNLQRQWESVVAEIFQLGVACLGEVDVTALFSTAGTDRDYPESTLFVPEHGSSAKKDESKRKRVSFAGPDMAALFPKFLLHTTGQQKLPPVSPDLPTEEFQHLEQTIADLGVQHTADLQRLEKEHQAWWKKKQTQLAHTFMQD